jgi:hypothetical protein
MRSLVELAPDARLRLDHVRTCGRGLLWVARWLGTQEGGPFEAPWITVSEHDAPGRVQRFDQYDLDQLEAARARFETIGPAASARSGATGATGDPFAALARRNAATDRVQAAFAARDWAAPPNAALRTSERIVELIVAGDWPALRALATADFRFEDRRKRALVSGDVELYIRNLQWVRSWRGRRVEPELLAIVGDRISLERIAFTGDVEGSAIEGEFLRLSEVDAQGRPRAVIHFDLDDRSAALEEAHARCAAREAARSGRP